MVGSRGGLAWWARLWSKVFLRRLHGNLTEPPPQLSKIAFLMTLTLSPQALANGGGHRSGSAGLVPLSLTPLIGRRHELDELRRTLSQNRLVTLLGPGGVGKTRLAAETARTSPSTGIEESRWVDLAAVGDDLVDRAIADAIGAHEGYDESAFGAVLESLSSRRVLLVLDNAEHVVGVVARICTELLLTCGGLHVLATSREPLGVAGEVVWRVPPLRAPGLEEGPEALARCEAVELFIDRAAPPSRPSR